MFLVWIYPPPDQSPLVYYLTMFQFRGPVYMLAEVRTADFLQNFLLGLIHWWLIFTVFLLNANDD